MKTVGLPQLPTAGPDARPLAPVEQGVRPILTRAERDKQRGELLAAKVELRDGTLYWTTSGWPVATQRDREGYRFFNISHNRRSNYFSEHRAIWFLHYGEWPKDQLDHINHIRDDNRIENLRDVSNEENRRARVMRPRPWAWKKGAGVHYRADKGSWHAKINVNGKRYWLGSFPTEAEARRAREDAEEKLRAAASGHNFRCVA